ncbi:transposase [Marinibaculum pumilum]|uniref:Transposase n=1 Tax=Marinibaculum pumilum TaxID=1766165 RepID=A0ABV7L0K1_9PROT
MTVERLEILSGVVRRRRWSRADKERLVVETLEPGVTVTEVARRHDLDRGLLYRWRQELGVVRNTEPVGFLPVEVARGTDTARPAACTSPSGMEIALPDGVRIRVDRTVDADALSRVLWALGRR